MLPIRLSRSLMHTRVAGPAQTPPPLISVSAQTFRTARREHLVCDAVGMLKKYQRSSPAGLAAHQPPMDLQQGICILLEPEAVDDLAIEGLDSASLSIRQAGTDQGQAEVMFQVIGVDHSGDGPWRAMAHRCSRSRCISSRPGGTTGLQRRSAAAARPEERRRWPGGAKLPSGRRSPRCGRRIRRRRRRRRL